MAQQQQYVGQAAQLLQLATNEPLISSGAALAARFNTMMRNLGLDVNARRGVVTNRFRRAGAMAQIREALETLADRGVDVMDRMINYFDNPDGPTTISFPSNEIPPVATVAALLTVSPAPDPLATFRYLMKIQGTETYVKANGEFGTRDVEIVRPINELFAQYGTNAIWAFLNEGNTAYATDDYYQISQYNAIKEWENVRVAIVRIPQGPNYPQPGGSFWPRWMKEHVPDDLSRYQVYKKSQITDMKNLLKEGVEFEDDLFAEPDCLGFALFIGGLEPHLLKEFYMYTARNTMAFFPSTKLNDMCITCGIKIDFRKYDRLKQDSSNNRRFCPPLNKGAEPEGYIPIGRLGNHYFLDEETKWTGPGARNFDLNWEYMGARASQMPPTYYYDKNLRREVGGERVLRSRNQSNREVKKLTAGELLCIFTFGTSNGRQGSLMDLMPLTDYAMQTDCFLLFKEQFRNQDLTMGEEEYSEVLKNSAKEYEVKGYENILTYPDGHYMGWKEYNRLTRKEGVKSGAQENVLERYTYPQINRLIDTKQCSFIEGREWRPKDRFGITAVRGKGKNMQKYFIPLKYTLIAFDTETYMKADSREAIPYMISIAYYEKEGEAFDFREWTELTEGSSPEDYGAHLVCKSFMGKACCKEMFDWLHQSSIFADRYLAFMAHNLNFDFNRLLRHAPNLWVTGGIFKSVSKTDCVEAILCPKKARDSNLRYGRRVFFFDSLSITQMPLAKFKPSFQLEGDIQKEIFPYDYYTEERITHWMETGDKMDLNTAISEGFPGNEAKQNEFRYAIIKSGCITMEEDTGPMLRPIEYAKFYCEQDCRVLMMGIMVLRGNCYNVPLIDPDPRFDERVDVPCEIDILHCVSIPQYATYYLGSNGVFQGAYNFCGVIRDYMARSVVGGRCMVEGNIPHMYGKVEHKGKEEPPEQAEGEHVVEDFDACSLYPTAMWRGCSEEHGHQGYPVGKPKLWKEGVDLSACAQYYITVRITKVGKPRRFPLFPSSKPGGGRHWSNDVIGKEFVFDKVQWEDAQTFQEAEGDILCGVYFNEGGNRRIGECMTFLYQNRLDQKKKENEYARAQGKEVCRAQSNLRKLIMNSSYGRMIMNPIEKEITFVYGRDLIEKFCFNHHHTIVEMSSVRDYDASKPMDMAHCREDEESFYIFQKYELVKQQKHRSMPHWGAFVLSESKRVMNEVMGAAEDVGARIHYQDTDSMHIVKAHIPKLEKEIQKRYGHRKLGSIISGAPGIHERKEVAKVPEALGRFHGDFAPVNKDPEKAGEYHAPISTFCVFIGKKMYFDYLIQHHKEDPEKTLVGAHAKMKGIPSKAVELYSRKIYDHVDDANDAMQRLYIDMLMGGKHSFDLTESGVKFKNKRDGSTIYLEEFVRKVGLQLDDAKLAFKEWEKWFPDTECPNPQLADKLKFDAFLEECEDLYEEFPNEDDDDENMAETQEVIMVEDTDEEEAPHIEEEEHIGLPSRKRSHQEMEEEEDPYVGDPASEHTPPNKRLRRYFALQGFSVGYDF